MSQLQLILARLTLAKELLSSAAPDALDRMAEVSQQVTDALRDASTFLRNFGAQADTGELQKLEALRLDFVAIAGTGGIRAAGGEFWKELLAQLALQLIDKLLRRS